MLVSQWVSPLFCSISEQRKSIINLLLEEMKWVRGEMIGKGSFGSVYLATPVSGFSADSLMAVKSASVSESSTLRKEKEILSLLSDCPQILKCFGEDSTVENGEELYNVFLELAPCGNLKDLVKNSRGGVLSECTVKHYAKSILKGLGRIHEEKYVHCDIKLENILLCKEPEEVKIADFRLAKEARQQSSGFGLSGTPLYMSPESISRNEQEAPSDIWALGCVVVEMITGRPAWNCRPDADVSALLFRIGFSEELPEIPEQLSDQGKDFLQKCFIKDPNKRWSAEMLLNHPFVKGNNTAAFLDCDKTSPSAPSPTSPFGFPQWSPSSTQTQSNDRLEGELVQFDSFVLATQSFSDRIRPLRTKNQNWASTDGWITVRDTKAAEAESLHTM